MDRSIIPGKKKALQDLLHITPTKNLPKSISQESNQFHGDEITNLG